jgi:N6-L-threonylcarbamoyladenine synthase
VSYSGLKTAVINQLERFWNPTYPKSPENIAASFERAAIDMILARLFKAAADTGAQRIVVGGGVAANSYLRSRLQGASNVRVYFPSRELCTDNAAMIAGVGYRYFDSGLRGTLSDTVSARVGRFRKAYP